ncbi:MAG: DNA repair protein RecO [Gemmobacter sp.]|nr:DNA repair protein RecO [Gemmobacter sp.]
MEWQDEGVLLAVRTHGESAAIIEVFTQAQGRHAGVVRGGAGRRMTPHLQPGTQLAVSWRARLEDQLGVYTVEPIRARAANLLADRRALAGLTAICALTARSLPERAPFPALYHATLALLDALSTVPDWPVLYLHWELRLLEELGFGLDLSQCAITGATEGLAYVSPRSGRAVTAQAAGDWAARLLPLPACLTRPGPATPDELAAGLRLTGHFLNRGLCQDPGARPLPEARARLADLLGRA